MMFRLGHHILMKTKRLRACARGAAAVEFALMVPVLMLVSIGVADFALVMNENMVLSNAARAGAQYAMASTDLTEAQVAAVVVEAGNFNAADLTVAVTLRCECANGSDRSCGGEDDEGDDEGCGEEDDDEGEGDTSVRRYVTVSVTETYETIFSYPWLDSPMTLTGYAEMRVF